MFEFGQIRMSGFGGESRKGSLGEGDAKKRNGQGVKLAGEVKNRERAGGEE